MSTTTQRLAPSKSWRSKPCAISATSCGRSSTLSTSPTWNRDGRRRAHSASRPASVAPPEDSSQPRLAAGCRWGGTEDARVILFPEGAIKLQGLGRQVLERCDGQRTFAQIIAELQAQFGDADPPMFHAAFRQCLESVRCCRV